jgi:hypothetical protein
VRRRTDAIHAARNVDAALLAIEKKPSIFDKPTVESAQINVETINGGRRRTNHEF